MNKETISKILVMGLLAAAIFSACSRTADEQVDELSLQVTEPLKNSSGKLFFAAQANSKDPYDIYFLNVETGKTYQLTDSGGEDIAPDFTGNSNLLVFSSNRGGSYDVYEMALPDGGAKRLTTASSDETEPRISPDGFRVVFQSDGSGDYDILTVDLKDGLETRLTQEDSEVTQPSWSPDGSRLVFVSNRDGDFELFSMAADGSRLSS